MKMTTMQYILLGAFALFALGGVLVFAGFGGTSRTSSETADISMWGVVPSSVIFSITDVINTKTPDAIKIIYTQKDESRLSVDLIEALADGNGPDVIMLPHNLLLELENKISNIPFSLLSERTFKDTFIESGEVFLNPVGTYAMPYIVDPLVMYWNRDIFSAKNFISPPRLWEEATVISSTVTEMSESKVIRKSGLSLGEFQNVTNAKEIILSLAAQVGSKLIQRNATGESYDNVILKNRGQSLVLPFEAAITFYTDFANPTSLRYSWNRSLPDSQKQFLSGKLAMYFGFASEYGALREKNPNLNFDVATIPQAKDAEINKTYANLYGLAILKSSKRQTNSFKAISLITGKDAMEVLTRDLLLPPVRRDLLSVFPNTSYGDVFYQSALWGTSPLDPSPVDTELYIKDMVESITSGSQKPKEALRDFSQKIDEIIR